MDCTVVVLPSVPELGVAGGRAKVEVATGGDMSCVGTGSVGTERTARSEDVGVRTADMEPSEGIEFEAGRTPLVKPMSRKALVVKYCIRGIKRASNFFNIASNTCFRVLHR
jgi:hypothetical protein